MLHDEIPAFTGMTDGEAEMRFENALAPKGERRLFADAEV